MLAQQLVNGVVVGSVYALFALGFTLVFGINRVLNLAHGAIFTTGAFAALYAITLLDLPLPIAALLAIVVGGAASLLVDLVCFRPLRQREAPEFAAIVSSIGGGLILTSVAQQISNTQVMRFPFGTVPVMVWRVWGLRLQLLQLVIVGSVAVIVLAMLFYLYRTRAGRQIRAVAISERTSQLLGISPAVVFAQVFFVAGALAGAAGLLIGLAFNSVQYLMGEPLLLRAFVVVVLGGMGSIAGAVVAGLLLGMVQTLSVAYASSGTADALIFSLLFVALLLRPNGLFGMAGTGRVVRA